MIMKIRWEFKKEDCWIGVYWERSDYFLDTDKSYVYPNGQLDIWICLIPCFPIHITKITEKK